MLYNNPQSVVAEANSGDATYLHNDVVFQKIVEKLTPPTIYNQNKELIEAFTQTTINYCPISINILDYWNKRNLSNVVEPLSESDFDTIPDDKIYQDDIRKAFFINSIKNLQERLAETYMNNFYTTAYKVRNSHTLRQKLYQLFNSFNIPMDDKNLLFNNINELFKEERFVTSKNFNMKKGKQVALKYAAQSAHDAEIEGPLTASSFFFDYEEVGPLNYKVDSVIIPDVYNAFVKPLAHPLGLGIDYRKLCKTDLTDRVFSKLTWSADGVSVKCTHPSDTLPTLPPPVLLPTIINPEWQSFVDAAIAINPSYDPYTPSTWIDGQSGPTMDKWIADLPYPSAIQNTENIIVNEALTGPWDPASTTPEMYFATKSGYGLWNEISSIDDGQGNILKDIQYGYGDEEFSGMNYTKYIFENGSYLIEYECLKSDKDVQRIIEYYRYDVFDTSIHDNVIAKDGFLNPELYPVQSGQDINIVHGTMGPDYNLNSDSPIKTQKLFTTEDGELNDTGGLDDGVFSGEPGTTSNELPFNYPNSDLPRVILNNPMDEGTHVTLVTHKLRSNRIDIRSKEPVFDLSPGLSAHYKLEIDASDATGNYDLANIGTPVYSGDYVSTSPGNYIKGAGLSMIGDYTVSVWLPNLDVNSNASDQGIITWGSSASGGKFGYIRINGNDVVYGNYFNQVEVNDVLVSGETNITIQFDATTTTNYLYINGTFIDSFVDSAFTGTTTMTIGAWYDGSNPYTGDISNIRIYKEVKNSTFVKALFAEGPKALDSIPFDGNDGKVFDAGFDVSNSSIWVNGVKLRDTEYSILDTTKIELVEDLHEGDNVEIIDNGSVNLIDFDSTLNQLIFPVTIGTYKVVAFVDGIKIDDHKFTIEDVGVESIGLTDRRSGKANLSATVAGDHRHVRWSRNLRRR